MIRYFGIQKPSGAIILYALNNKENWLRLHKLLLENKIK